MPAKKAAKKVEVTFTKDKDGVTLDKPIKVKFPAYKPVGRTRAQTKALMEKKGMHPAMIEQATKFMKK